jgi:hypothetical protein
MKMKKILVCLIILCISGSMLYAQEEATNSSFLNIGTGILPGLGGSASYDYKLISIQNSDALTIGGYMGYSRRDGYGLEGSSGGVAFWESKSLLSPRIGYNYLLSKKVGIYGIVMPGVSIERLYLGTEYSFFTGFSAGIRIQMVRRLYLFAECGYNVLCVNSGISFAF